MARAVQCPACGQAHRFDTLADTPTFSCAGCGRTLRTPTELVRPSGSTPAVSGSSGPGAAVAASRPAPGAPKPKPRPKPRANASPPRRGRRPRRTPSGKVGLPIRIGAWVIAVGLGLVLTWLVASAVGFLSRAQLVDMFRSSHPTNYTRLFLLIPVWAFMSACVATACTEGARMFLARRAAAVDGPGEEKGRRPRPPARATRVPEAADPAEESAPARPPLPPGQRSRIRPREPTV